ncbi:MAG: BlaI/MecI/CopY family transcriptional regulator [Gemmatimonadota bacterium]
MGKSTSPLSKRERQVMDALYGLGEATVGEIMEQLEPEMSYSAVRSVLRVLAGKKQVRRRYNAPRYVYSPLVPPEAASTRALDHVVRTFFGGSFEAAAAALLRRADIEVNQVKLRELAHSIQRAKREGR